MTRTVCNVAYNYLAFEIKTSSRRLAPGPSYKHCHIQYKECIRSASPTRGFSPTWPHNLPCESEDHDSAEVSQGNAISTFSTGEKVATASESLHRLKFRMSNDALPTREDHCVIQGRVGATTTAASARVSASSWARQHQSRRITKGDNLFSARILRRHREPAF